MTPLEDMWIEDVHRRVRTGENANTRCIRSITCTDTQIVINQRNYERVRIRGEWVDSIVDLMCENMVYGTMIASPMNNGTNLPYNYRIEKGQLPLFQMAPQYTFNRSGAYWLRDVVSSVYFALVAYTGDANTRSASSVFGVRPAFCIG